MGAYDYYFLGITGVFYFPNYGGGETPAPGQLDTVQEVETELPQFVSDVLNAPGYGATSWIGPNYADGYFYGITQDLDYLNSVIGPGQQQVQYIEELPYYGQYAYDFVISAAQAATDNNALAAIVSDMNFTTALDASTQDYVITGENPSLSGADYKLYVEDSVANVAQYFQTILANAPTYGNFGTITMQPSDSGAAIGAAFDTLILPFMALAEAQNSSVYTITTNYGTNLVVSLQVTDFGGAIPITISDYGTYAAAPNALKGILEGLPPLEISDSVANVDDLSLADISTFAANDVTQITAPGSLTFSIAQVLALVQAGAFLEGVSASVSDTGKNIGNLSIAQIDQLQHFGISSVTVQGGSVYLNAAQLNELSTDNITVSAPSGEVIFQDSDANIASFNVSLLLAVGVTQVYSIDTPGQTVFALPAATVLGLANANIPAFYGDGATPLTVVADTNADIGDGRLTPPQIDALHTYGIVTIAANDSLYLSANQLNEFYDDGVTVVGSSENQVIFSDTVANIQAFDLSILASVGVNLVRSLDEPSVTPFTLTIQQALTLAGENIPAVDPSGNTATVADSASNIEALTTTQVDTLEQDGFTTIENTTAAFLELPLNTLALNAPLVMELVQDGVTILNPGQSTIYYDTASYFNDNSMDSQILSGMQALGFTGIETTDGPVTIYLAQFTALPFAVQTPSGSGPSTIADVAVVIDYITDFEITQMPRMGFGILQGYTPLTFNVDQILEIEKQNIVTEGPDPSVHSTTVSDGAIAIEGLSQAQIQSLPGVGVGVLNGNDGPLTFDAAHAGAIVNAGIAVTALSGAATVTVEDSAANLATLLDTGDEVGSEAAIEGIYAAGIGAIVVSSGDFDLTVGEALTIFGDNIALAAIDGATLTIVDSATAIDALTIGQIKALDDSGFAALESNSGELSFNVILAQALAESGMTLSDPSPGTITVSDTAANLQILSAEDIDALRATGFNALAAQSGALALKLDPALAAVQVDQDDNVPMSVSAPGGVTVTDTADNFTNTILTDDDISALHEAGFAGFVASDGPLFLSVNASLTIVADNMTVSGLDGDVVVYDTDDALQGLTADQIATLANAGFTGLEANDGSLHLSVDQALAVDATQKITVTAPDGDFTVIYDSSDNLESLTGDQITALYNHDGFTAIESTDPELDLTVAQVLALANANYTIVKLSADDVVTVTDSASNLGTLTPADIALIGNYDPIALVSNDGELDLSVAQAVAVLNDNSMTVAAPGDEFVVVLDAGTTIATLSAEQISGLNMQGFDRLTSNSGPLDLNVAQALAVDNAGMGVFAPDGEAVTVVDGGSQIETLTDFKSLADDGFTALQSNDGGLAFTVQQAQVFEDADLTLSAPSGSFVSVTDGGTAIAGLARFDITELGKDGFTQLNSNAGDLDLTVQQALGVVDNKTMTVSAPEDAIAVVQDSADAIEGLTADEFPQLSAAGFTELAANDEELEFTAQTALAIEEHDLKVDAPDFVAVTDSAGAIQDLEADEITALGQDGFTQLNSNDGELDLSVAQAMAVDGDETMTVSASDGEDVVIKDHATLLEGIGADDFGSLAQHGFTALHSDDGGLDFTVEQAVAIDEAKFTVVAASNNYVSVTDTAEAIEGLTSDDLADLAKDGFDTLTTDNATLQVGVAEALGILNNGLLVNVPAGDEKLVIDTPANIATLTSSEIAGLENDGFLIGSGVTINNGSINVDGELNGSGTINGTVTIGPTGLVTVDSGTLDVASGSVVNNNQITVSGATLDLGTGVDLSGTGTVDVTDGAIQLDGSVSSGQTFIIDPSTIEIGDPAGFSGTLQLTPGDEIIVDGVNGGSYANGKFTVTENGDFVGTITAPGYGSNDFSFSSSDNTLDINVACYCRGTLIEAKYGQTPVERLKIGDVITTAAGALRPIKWIGRRSYGGRFILGRTDILPICFKAGALGDNLPKRDLWVSPNHAMYFKDEQGGVLIEAKDLINGISVLQADSVDSIEYFHVELDTHDLIIAEGALSETFIDDDSRGTFHNTHEYRRLYAEDEITPAHYCAPRLDSGYELEAIRRRIALLAGATTDREVTPGTLRGNVDQVASHLIEGWAQNLDHPEAPVCLDIFAGGMLVAQVLANQYRGDLELAGIGSGHHSFSFKPPGGLAFSADAVEVRRSFDGAVLCFAAKHLKMAI